MYTCACACLLIVYGLGSGIYKGFGGLVLVQGPGFCGILNFSCRC